MTTRARATILLAISALAVMATSWMPFYAALAQDAPPDRPGRRGDGPPSVERAMKGMERSLKQLSEHIADPARIAENLLFVNEAQRFCVAAKGQPVPEDVLSQAKDETARKELSRIFHRDLIAVLKKLVEIEEHLLDGKPDAAETSLKAIQRLRDDSHKAMGVKDDH